MKLRHPSSPAFIIIAASALALTSCSNSILFATNTSTGLDVSGDIEKVPDHVSLGFRRRELAYVGEHVPKSAPLLGRLDSETNWNGGIAIRETFATGKAATLIASGGGSMGNSTDPVVDPKAPNEHNPLIFISRTRVGFGFSVGGAEDDSVPSLHIGYNRRIATRMRVDPKKSGKEIPSVVADTTVHGSGVLGRDKAPAGGLDSSATLSDENEQGGLRIRQLFATGAGATALLENKEKARELRAAIVQEPKGNPQ